MVLIVVLNVALAVFVILAIAGLQLWAIVTSNPREELPSLRLRRAPRQRRSSRRPAAQELACAPQL